MVAPPASPTITEQVAVASPSFATASPSRIRGQILYQGRGEHLAFL